MIKRMMATWIFSALLPSFIFEAPVGYSNEAIKIKSTQTSAAYLAFQSVQNKSDIVEESLAANEVVSLQSNTFFYRSERNTASINQLEEKPNTVDESAPTIREMIGEGEHLSNREKNRIELAERRSHFLENTYTEKSPYQELSERLAIAKKEVDSQLERQSNSEHHPQIYIAATTPDGKTVTYDPKSAHGADVVMKPQNDDLSLSGNIQFEPGLGLNNNSHIELRRWQNGVPQEMGLVDPLRGTYAITLPSLSGSLVARVFDDNGTIVGEGTRSIREGNKNIIIKASRHAVKTHTTEYGNDKPVQTMMEVSTGENSKSSPLGSASIQNIAMGSQVVARFSAPKYYPTNTLMRAGFDVGVQLFKESTVQALRSLSEEKMLESRFAQNGSIIYGIIESNGKPVSGARVELEDLEGVHPIYLGSALLPDSTLQETSESGVFVFFDIPEGMHSIVAKVSGKYISHINVVNQEDVLTMAKLETSKNKNTIEVKAFDPFSGQPLPTRLTLQSADNSIFAADGFTSFEVDAIDRLSLLEAQTVDSYEVVEGVYNDTDSEVLLPIPQSQWLNQIVTEKRISIAPDTTKIVGFVTGDDFDAFLAGAETYAKENIVYFDLHGNVIDHGVAGGGFILFNVPEGAQSVVLVPKSSKNLSTRIVPADIGRSTVVNFNLL